MLHTIYRVTLGLCVCVCVRAWAKQMKCYGWVGRECASDFKRRIMGFLPDSIFTVCIVFVHLETYVRFVMRCRTEYRLNGIEISWRRAERWVRCWRKKRKKKNVAFVCLAWRWHNGFSVDTPKSWILLVYFWIIVRNVCYLLHWRLMKLGVPFGARRRSPYSMADIDFITVYYASTEHEAGDETETVARGQTDKTRMKGRWFPTFMNVPKSTVYLRVNVNRIRWQHSTKLVKFNHWWRR